MGTSTTAERTWPIRLLALAAALAMVVTGLVATSTAATAENHAEITSPTEDEVIFSSSLQLSGYHETTTSEEVTWAVRKLDREEDEASQDLPCWGDPSGENDIVGNVRGNEDDIGWELAELGTGSFDATFPISGWEPGEYCFVISSLSNNGEEPNRMVRWFKIWGEVDECGDGDTCSVEVEDEEGHSFTATATGNPKEGVKTSLLGLRVPSGGVAKAVYEACNSLVEDSVMRLGDGIAHLVPVGFDGGDITVTSTIPMDVVYGEDDEARGEGIFDVCVAPEEPDYAGYGGDGENALEQIMDDGDEPTGFYGPVLLENCRGGPHAKDACVEARDKDAEGNVVLTYRIPAEDPMLR